MYIKTTPDTWTRTNTSTPPKHEYDQTYHFVSTLVVAVLSMIITIANLFVVGTFYSAKKIRGKTANLLLCNQAVVDVYNGAFVGGMAVFGTKDTPELLRQSVYQLSMGLSIHTILLISIERYLFILKPFFHRSSLTRGRMLGVVVLSWVVSFVWLLLRLIHFNESDEDEDYMIFIAVSDSYMLLLMLTVGYLHVITYQAIQRFIKHRYHDLINAQRTPLHQENTRMKQHMKEIRVSKIFIGMFVAFIFTYTPVFITGIIFITEAYKQFPKSTYKYFSLDLIFYLCNSIFNPVITLTFKEDYRKNICKFFANRDLLTIFTRYLYQNALIKTLSSTTVAKW